MAATERHLTPSLAGVSAWIVTDGKAGDESQCLAVAEAAGLVPEIRRVAPRTPWRWLMPWGPPDPSEAPGRGSLSGRLPDIVIGSGRKAVPSVRALKAASRGRTFTVILKDPRTGPGSADFIWAPEHDRIRGPNVVTTLSSPHRATPARLAAARGEPDARLTELPAPRIAVLVGGPAHGVAFDDAEQARLLENLRSLHAAGGSLMVTASRRTPSALRTALRRLETSGRAFIWDEAGDNPHMSILALAEAVVVTADSINMVSEAVATGVPVLAYVPKGLPRRHRAFLEGLETAGAVRRFSGILQRFTYAPLDATPLIADALARAYAVHRSRLVS